MNCHYDPLKMDKYGFSLNTCYRQVGNRLQVESRTRKHGLISGHIIRLKQGSHGFIPYFVQIAVVFCFREMIFAPNQLF
jgi:hypothetical protein